jgi:hypothetical protein
LTKSEIHIEAVKKNLGISSANEPRRSGKHCMPQGNLAKYADKISLKTYVYTSTKKKLAITTKKSVLLKKSAARS